MDVNFINVYYFTAITKLKDAFKTLDARVSVLEGKSPNVSIFELITNKSKFELRNDIITIISYNSHRLM